MGYSEPRLAGGAYLAGGETWLCFVNLPWVIILWLEKSLDRALGLTAACKPVDHLGDHPRTCADPRLPRAWCHTL